MGRDTAGRLIVKTREPICCVPTNNGATLQEKFLPSTSGIYDEGETPCLSLARLGGAPAKREVSKGFLSHC